MIIDWIANLDADLEFADPARRPSRRLAGVTAAMARTFLGLAARATPGMEHRLLGSGDAGDALQAWSPNSGARARARACGRELRAPDDAVLRRCNHRAFAIDLQAKHNPLPTRFLTRAEEVFDAIQAMDAPGGCLLKRPFGFSGRGRKHAVNGPTQATRRWIEASMSEYGVGLGVEPFVLVDVEFALHGWLDDQGLLTGDPTRLWCDDRGGWLQSTRAEDAIDPTEVELLHRAFRDVADQLAAAGYSGPFSIDAFRYREGTHTRFQPLSEINARYSMGYFVGMARGSAAWAERVL